MSKKTAKMALAALNKLGLALVDEDHVWTNEERRLYESAARTLTAMAA